MGGHATIHGVDDTNTTDAGGRKWVPIKSDPNGNAKVSLGTQLAGERNPGTANAYGVAVPEWNYTIVDHADTSPVAVSSGAPAIIGGIYCSETMAGTPDFALYDGTTEVINLPTGMVLGDERDSFAGIRFDTDLDVVIATAGTAGIIVVAWRAQ